MEFDNFSAAARRELGSKICASLKARLDRDATHHCPHHERPFLIHSILA
jgi:hypothetical protein